MSFIEKYPNLPADAAEILQNIADNIPKIFEQGKADGYTEGVASKQVEIVEISAALDAIIAIQEGLIGGNDNVLVPSEGLSYLLTEDGAAYYLSGRGTCTDSIIVVPDTYNGKPVVGFAFEGGFSGDSIIEEIHLPNTPMTFSNYPINDCPNLKRIYIPILYGISSFEFDRLPALEYVEISDCNGACWIGGGTFAWCDGLTLDLTKMTHLPELDSYGEGSEFGTNPRILVNSLYYNQLVNAEGWSNYANYIEEVAV